VNRLLTSLLLLVLVTPAAADTTSADSLLQPDSLLQVDSSLLVDTMIYRPGSDLLMYRVATDSTNLEERMIQNPTLALFKSLVIPGWGQLGNRSYIKAILFAGLDAYLVSNAIHYRNEAADRYDRYESVVLPLPADSCSSDPDCNSLRNQKNGFYDDYLASKDQRNKFIWFAVITAFVSMFDAYVDAHLSGFPRRSDARGVDLDVRATPNGELSAVVSIPF
jgi:hypothetical protein